MQRCDTLIIAGWVVPVEPHNHVLSNHAVALTDGDITAVLPADEARKQFEPGVLLDRPDHVLIPGLVNVHTHAAMTLLSGMGDDLTLERLLR